MATTRVQTYLLVEDNADHAELLRLSIEAARPSVRLHHARDGVDALSFLHGDAAEGRPAILPDLILLDLKLPRLGGLHVLHAVKSDPDLKKIPVVVLTTSDADHDRRSAYRSYANSYLVKPVGFDQLQVLVGELTHYWSETNVSPTPA
jgi:CheY-like chemotaxis protein